MAKKSTTTKSTPGFDAPQSRNEAILQNILGADNVLGEPQSRIEALLMAILEQGGGGGGAVDSVNGQTGTVVLTAADFDIYRVIYTVDLDTNAATCNKTANEIFTAMQSGKAVEAFLVAADSGYTIGHLSSVMFGGTTLVWSAQDSSNLYLLFHTIADNQVRVQSIDFVNSINGQTGAVVLDAGDVGAQTPFLTATITIAVSDWNNGSCTKTVTGMTADALVFVKYSDPDGEYTETQGTNSMTFTAATTPSEAVTVNVAWFV